MSKKREIKGKKIKKIKKICGDDKWLRRKVGGSSPTFLSIRVGEVKMDEKREKKKEEKMKEKRKRKMKKK